MMEAGASCEPMTEQASSATSVIKEMNQFHAVLCERDDACRAAAISALVSFNFQADNVHGVREPAEIVEKVKNLQVKHGTGQSSHIVVFLSSLDNLLFPQQKFLFSQTFVVTLSESATEVIVAEPNTEKDDYVHCTMPKKLDDKLLAVLALAFRPWAEAKKQVQEQEHRVSSFHEAAARKKQGPRGGRALRPGAAAVFQGISGGAQPSGMNGINSVAQSSCPVGVRQSTEPASPLLHEEFPDVVPPLDTEMSKKFAYLDLAGRAHTGFTPTPEKISTPSDEINNRCSSSLSKLEAKRHSGSNPSYPATGVTDRGNTLKSLSYLRDVRKPFDDVIIEELAGRGSFGTVYKAQWDGSIVALKVIRHDAAPSPKKASASFEAALASSLTHPNLVQTFKYSLRETANDGQDPDFLGGVEVWIVQEWCALGSLGDDAIVKKILSTGGFADVAEVSCEIAAAGSYLHLRGIVHGDLSRNNVLLNLGCCQKGFIAKVCDFGMARVLGESSAIETVSMGTVAYMPPELFVVEPAPVTTKVDVYAFGVILWVLCNGKRPFEKLTKAQIVVQVAAGSLKLEIPDFVPADIREVYTRSTVRDPFERPTFESLVHQLLQIRQKETANTRSLKC